MFQSELENKVVVITGAASGIGLACVSAFLKKGALVVACDRKVGKFENKSYKYNSKLIIKTMDVRDLKIVQKTFRSIVKETKKIDILITCAALPIRKKILKTSPKDWKKIINTNLSGVFYCSQTAAKFMHKAKTGKIIHLSSVNGARAITGRGAYAVAKGGVNMLTKMMAAELGQDGVTVNAIAPGPVQTPMVNAMHTKGTRKKWYDSLPIKRYATLKDVISAVLFLTSESSNYINGHILPVDGGFLAAGILMDKN